MPLLGTRGSLSAKGFGFSNHGRVPYNLEFLVIAGGGSGGTNGGSGAGAGGYRASTQFVQLDNTITITVGAGGPTTGRVVGPQSYTSGLNGFNSSISGSGLTTITSAGGGYGGVGANNDPPNPGGSGGGGHQYGQNIGNAGSIPGASGNVPSTSPSQGNNGGNGVLVPGPYFKSAGGGGAGGVGGNAPATANSVGGVGGAGSSSSITGSSVTRASGGSGYLQGTATPGGGGAGNSNPGTVNTGGGGGGNLGAGGSGVVILSMPASAFSGIVTGSPVQSISGTKKILIYNGSGTYNT